MAFWPKLPNLMTCQIFPLYGIMLQTFEFKVASSFLIVYAVVTPVSRERCTPANSSDRTAATQKTDTRERSIHMQLAESSGQFDIPGTYRFHISNQLGTKLLRDHLTLSIHKACGQKWHAKFWTSYTSPTS